MYKGLIFDFDGTLVRSHREVFAVLEELSTEYGLALPPPEQFRHLSTIGSSMLGKHKNISKILKLMALSPSDCLYVGDETRDIEACKKVGIPVAAVTWGFHSQEKLRVFNPNFLVESIEELQALFLRSEQ